MIDTIDFLQQGPQLGTVIHISTRKKNIRRKRLRVAHGKIVQTTYLVTFTNERIGKLGT